MESSSSSSSAIINYNQINFVDNCSFNQLNNHSNNLYQNTMINPDQLIVPSSMMNHHNDLYENIPNTINDIDVVDDIVDDDDDELALTLSSTTINNHQQQQQQQQIRSQSRMSISHDKGLLNMPGQNNCFLNSAVQVLWHLDIFRRSFRELQGHACMSDSCIFCALKELFNQFQCSTETALPPDTLRFALSQSSINDQRKFRLGYMDDAAECFENILFRIHYHITNKEIDSTTSTTTMTTMKCLPHCISHEKFSMNLYEQINCYQCGATSKPFIFSQMVHYISTSALCNASAATVNLSSSSLSNNTNYQNIAVNQIINDNNNDNDNGGCTGKTFGQLIKMVNSIGDVRNCPKSCGAKMNIEKKLLNRPDIISIGLVWDTDHPTLSLMKNVYQLIDTNIRLNEIFNLSETHGYDDCVYDEKQNLNLVGLVTYYGKHYSTYMFNTKLSQWVYFDDANVRMIGTKWSSVVDKCIKGHFQPLLLLYSNPNAKIIDTQYALKENIPMTVINRKPVVSHNNNNGESVNSSPPSTMTVTTKTMQSPIPPPIPPHARISKSSSSIETKTMKNLNSDSISHHYHHNTHLNNQKQHQQQQQQNPLSYHHNVSHHYNSDVPDSPSATSTASYFSDVGADSTDGYISRKTVENIIKIQQKSKSNCKNKSDNLEVKSMMNTNNNNNIYYNQKYNRNSSSSLESFDSVVRSSKLVQRQPTQQPPSSSMIMNGHQLQRRDSGNSSSERASSVSSNDTPYHYSQRQQLMSKNSHRNSQLSSKNASDQGYDSFSLSSSDSYPSTISPSKLNNRLKQIPEDESQLIEMVANLTTMDECDKLCSEADILLLKSHEKEREGDLRAAAALSDSAAAKARSAMDIPYSNHQKLISAKMKHSMCVMRSTSLHKRVVELETEEKRLLKAAAIESGHSRQSSRDSSYGRHSRQSSRDAKDSTKSSNKQQSQQQQQQNDDNNMNEMIKSKINDNKNWPSPEIYATLPKKSKRPSSSTILKDQKNSIIYDNVVNKLKDKINNNNNNNDESVYENLPQTITVVAKTAKSNQIKSQNHKSKSSTKIMISDSEFSDYYSEWEIVGKKKNQLSTKHFDSNNSNGWQSCRENNTDSDIQESPSLKSKSSINGLNKKSNAKNQCKVKKKLMFGHFLKTKNQSLPDLREKILQSTSNDKDNIIDENDSSLNKSKYDENIQRSVAQINAKGFHQSHRSFVAEQGFKSKPLLIKVKPPAVVSESKKPLPPLPLPPLPSASTTEDMKLDNAVSTTAPQLQPNLKREKPIPPKRNLFLEELNRKRNEIMNPNRNDKIIYGNLHSENKPQFQKPKMNPPKSNPIEISTQGPTPVPTLTNRKPSMFEITNLITKNSPSPSPLSSTSIIHAPIPVNPIHQITGKATARIPKPPDYETTIKRLNHQKQQQQQQSMNPIYTNISTKSTIIEQCTNFNNSKSSMMMMKTPTIIANNVAKQTNRSINDNNDNSKQLNIANNEKHKKSVKFSDQIELVACADDLDMDNEPPLPNLLLEKVLGKQQNIVYTMHK